MSARIAWASGMQGDALFREHGRQVAALCWRVKADSTLEVLLITSRSRKRWIMPKGWLEPDMTPADNAAREAFEEAGVTGKVKAEPIGSYHYLKEKKDGGGVPCQVDVFALAVSGQLEDWPEKNLRSYAWLPVDQAVSVVAEPGLRQILKDFRKRHAPVKARRITA
ncbi:MAG TPA: NUDIX hydrolase [Rhizomicrobium sp.]|nr:NUDIX hydrolase [Rhizomicrobium sp.]